MRNINRPDHKYDAICIFQAPGHSHELGLEFGNGSMKSHFVEMFVDEWTAIEPSLQGCVDLLARPHTRHARER